MNIGRYTLSEKNGWLDFSDLLDNKWDANKTYVIQCLRGAYSFLELEAGSSAPTETKAGHYFREESWTLYSPSSGIAYIRPDGEAIIEVSTKQ